MEKPIYAQWQPYGELGLGTQTACQKGCHSFFITMVMDRADHILYSNKTELD